MSICPITIVGEKKFISVLWFEAISEVRFHRIQRKLVAMLQSENINDRAAALYCIRKAQAECDTLTAASHKILCQMGYIRDDLLIDAVCAVGRAGFSNVTPETPGAIRGWQILNPFLTETTSEN